MLGFTAGAERWKLLFTMYSTISLSVSKARSAEQTVELAGETGKTALNTPAVFPLF